MVYQSSKTLYHALWKSVDVLRSKMDAVEYKSYLLSLIFYKYLSDKMLYNAAELLEEEVSNLNEAQRIYVNAINNPKIREVLIEELKYDFSFALEPELTFTSLVQAIHNGKFQLEYLVQGFRSIEQSNVMFENLFKDVDFYSKKLGSTAQKQNETISIIMKELSLLDITTEEGVIGDAYQYLIGKFASDSGKKAGEFYTPQTVSKLIAKIVVRGKENQKSFSVYDPTMGTGSLLLNIKKVFNEPGTVAYFGQELNTSIYKLARMNMILNGVYMTNQHLRNADTLDTDWPREEPTTFDGVLMNPPYSAKWSADKKFWDDPRFLMYGELAPKSKADFAFLLHGFYHLKDSGTMAIVLPQGVLFRGAAEGIIRKKLLEDGSIYAVIGLPANLFFGTSIPTTIIILKKKRSKRDILFIDASNEFKKEKNQNALTEEHINKILKTYIQRKDVEKYAHLASYDEIVGNDYNLNIPRYVEVAEEEEEVSLMELLREMQKTRQELQQAEYNLLDMLNELEGTNEDAQQELQRSIQVLGGEVND